jgi:hypothetical protein
MNTARLDELEAAIRSSVARGSYNDAQERLPDLRAAVETALQGCPPGSRDAQNVVRRTMDLLRWASRATQAGRADQKLVLSGITSAARYHPPARRTSRLWLDA